MPLLTEGLLQHDRVAERYIWRDHLAKHYKENQSGTADDINIGLFPCIASPGIVIKKINTDASQGFYISGNLHIPDDAILHIKAHHRHNINIRYNEYYTKSIIFDDNLLYDELNVGINSSVVYRDEQDPFYQIKPSTVGESATLVKNNERLIIDNLHDAYNTPGYFITNNNRYVYAPGKYAIKNQTNAGFQYTENMGSERIIEQDARFGDATPIPYIIFDNFGKDYNIFNINNESYMKNTFYGRYVAQNFDDTRCFFHRHLYHYDNQEKHYNVEFVSYQLTPADTKITLPVPYKISSKSIPDFSSFYDLTIQIDTSEKSGLIPYKGNLVIKDSFDMRNQSYGKSICAAHEQLLKLTLKSASVNFDAYKECKLYEAGYGPGIGTRPYSGHKLLMPEQTGIIKFINVPGFSNPIINKDVKRQLRINDNDYSSYAYQDYNYYYSGTAQFTQTPTPILGIPQNIAIPGGIEQDSLVYNTDMLYHSIPFSGIIEATRVSTPYSGQATESTSHIPLVNDGLYFNLHNMPTDTYNMIAKGGVAGQYMNGCFLGCSKNSLFSHKLVYSNINQAIIHIEATFSRFDKTITDFIDYPLYTYTPLKGENGLITFQLNNQDILSSTAMESYGNAEYSISCKDVEFPDGQRYTNTLKPAVLQAIHLGDPTKPGKLKIHNSNDYSIHCIVGGDRVVDIHLDSYQDGNSTETFNNTMNLQVTTKGDHQWAIRNITLQ